MNIAIVGLGLIGGSLAKSIKKNTPHKVLGLDKSRDVLNSALRCGAVDEALASPADLGAADITFICLYPGDSIKFTEENAGCFKKGSIVADTCGIKSGICKRLNAAGKKNGFIFIGAHPMAGSEKSGFTASRDNMFDGASFIITPVEENPEAVKTLTSLAKEMGFAQTVTSDPKRHDEMIALTSQLPHVLACAYVLDPDTVNHRGFSGGSFRDVSRVAEINDRLWCELFIENREALSGKINNLIINLQRLDDAVSTCDYNTLGRILRTARKKKEEIDA